MPPPPTDWSDITRYDPIYHREVIVALEHTDASSVPTVGIIMTSTEIHKFTFDNRVIVMKNSDIHIKTRFEMTMTHPTAVFLSI